MLGKILVVDDEEIIRESLSFILRKEGYEVDEAENGRVAQSKLLEGKYDIVVTDLEMPQMRGIELLEEIKKLDIHTSIIIITAFGSLDTAISALRAGASDYILKPIEFDELLIKLKRMFEVKELLLENRRLNQASRWAADFENLPGYRHPIKIPCHWR